MNNFTVSGNIVDLIGEKIFAGTIFVENGKIAKIQKVRKVYKKYIMPGFIDAHVHIESSMLPPSEFARLASVHGTVATVSDPHEIANVMGMEGIKFMLENAKTVPFKFFFGAPSCVPATNFESSGASLGVKEIEQLFKKYDLKYLSEMMNFPGVIYGDKEVEAKLKLAKKNKKPIDGHAPGLIGEMAEKYVKAGITTDHECYSLEEAIEKIKLGMKILIREGSAAKNFETLAPLIEEYPEMCMFCTDDAHPDSLSEGHIRDIVLRAFDLGYDVMDVLQAATLNPIKHYGLEVGLLQIGDPADFIVIDSFQNFGVEQTYVNGELIAEKGKTLIPHKKVKPINKFNCKPKVADDFKYFPKTKTVKVIKAIDGELITEVLNYKPKFAKDDVEVDLEKDILKITDVNRYENSIPAVALINNFGLKKGSIATSVAHDSHNLIAIGTDNESIAKVINALIETKGGMVVYDGKGLSNLALPIAGLMATEDGYEVAKKYKELTEKAKEIGCTLTSPFMTLSFMALLVIPKLKLSDKGLFDGEKFELI